ncbi:outer dense fiber protein 3-like [Copidosoma floridanum]|uniref:outer dense fiber protein 3-like n=1 Tax=Copidosoma floridanum TaxID=29053 RepID=UPI0006C97AED|nr:outer dense fiber protein 3-like [Copidosoma floridanum]
MDYEKSNKSKSNSCKNRGPGPKYMLKTLTGFDDHDPSKRRYPAYSLKFRGKKKIALTGPGPYPVTGKMTHHGLESSPAYTIASKYYKRFHDKVPGPGAYAPEKGPLVNHQRRAAAYTIRFRHHKIPYKDGPGPIYMLPTCIGPEIPDIRAEGAYSMAFKHKQRQENLGPGPAAYSIKLATYKRQNPAYSMKFRHNLFDLAKKSPGPQYSYNLNLIKKRQPIYSFGVKYSECTTVGLLENDD